MGSYILGATTGETNGNRNGATQGINSNDFGHAVSAVSYSCISRLETTAGTGVNLY